MIVTARTEDGRVASFVTADPPTAAALERWRLLASMPGLAEAEWTGRPGDSVVARRTTPNPKEDP